MAVIYITAYASTTMFSILLIRFAEGAVFTTVVLALVTPLSTLFWMLFQPMPTLHFEPVFDLSMIFVIVGLLIMMPAVIMYAYLGNGNYISPADENANQTTMEETSPRVPAPPPRRRVRTQSLNLTYARPDLAQVPKQRTMSGPSTMYRVRSAPIMTF